jgi:hypothetical protein
MAGLYDVVAALQSIGAELKNTASEAEKASKAVGRKREAERTTASGMNSAGGASAGGMESSNTNSPVTTVGLKNALSITRMSL